MRSQLSRIMQESIKHQQEHTDNDHAYWYRVDASRLSKELQETFLLSRQDEETQQFLDNCFTKSDYFFTQIYQGIAKSILTWFMSSTSANGWLGRGSMFVFSSNQFKSLLGVSDDWHAECLLDLGAGDGKVTEKMASMFREIHVTEISSVMCRCLEQLSYKVIAIDEWKRSDVYYDIISCLNLLDRCDKPITMLKSMQKKLKPESGILLLALVFPLKQYVEVTPDHKASESLFPNVQPATSANNATRASMSLEDQVSSFVLDILTPAGFSVIRWTRLPYLCEGDMARSFYSLGDIVFVLKVTNEDCMDAGGDTCF